MLVLNLNPIFKARGISNPYHFLSRAGLSHNTITNILQNEASLVKLKHIELFCELLVCEPNDLLAWTPDKDKTYSANHPLFKLQAQDGGDWEGTLGAMPFKELKELTKSLAEKAKE